MPQPTLFSFLKTASQQKKDDGGKTNQETKDKFNTVSESPKKSKRFGVKEGATEDTTCTPRKDSVTKQTDRKQVKQKTSEDAKKQKLLLQDKIKKSPPKKPDSRAEFDSCAKNNKMKRDIGSTYRSEDKMSHSGPVTKRQKTEESIKQTESSKKKHIKKSPTSSKEHKEDESDVNRNSNNIDSEKNTGEVESDCESPVKRAKSSKTKSRTARYISSSESDLENGDGEDAKTSEQSTELESKTKNSETGIRGVDCSADDSKPALHSFFAPRKGGRELASESTKSPKDSKEEGGYDPTKHNYHPVNDACWKKGEKVPYLALAKTLHEIEKISGRLKMIEILANFFRSVIALTPDDLLHCVYLCLNRIAPEYEGIELGVGEMLLIKAVAQATGRTVGQIKSEVSVKGDLGLVAESSRGSQRVMFSFPKLTVSSVFTKFRDISQMTGSSVMAKKIDKIQAMFSACRLCEARYIIRSLSGKLRIGLAEQSVLSALALAAVLTPPGQPDVLNSSSKMSSDSFKKELEAKTLILKTTYCECPNYDLIIPVLLKEGISGLPEHCHLMPGIPLKPMLAHPTKGIDEVLRRFDTSDSKIEFTCEFKYDGERAQIHNTGDGEIKIYSRNQEDNTSKYPDIISRLGKATKPETKSFILDSEVVAWDREASHILPFQVLSTRKKKDAADSDIKVQVCVMAFDLLYLNGEALVRKPLKERRELLHNAFVEVPSEFMFAHSTDGNSAEVMQEFLEESVKGHCEGLMVKSLVIDATYEIAKRSHNWLKLKKDYLEGVGDTLDLVVIGGWYGKGKRTGSYGGFLLACYDDETEEFQTICKIGTGFKDSDLEAHTKFLKAYVINSAGLDYRYSKNLEPDVWFEAVQVWEVKCADLSISPVHKAAVGIVDPEKGISLRFPRFLRIRDDKKPEDATKAIQVAYMYNNQQQVKSASKDSKADDEDYY